MVRIRGVQRDLVVTGVFFLYVSDLSFININEARIDFSVPFSVLG